jgi:hypothetical protein
MKKVKIAIIFIYIIAIVGISASAIFFTVNTVTKGVKMYFQEIEVKTPPAPLNEQEIEKLIEELKNYRLI